MTLAKANNRAEARRLLRDPAARGDHGFSGARLPAWREQRLLIRAALRIIAKNGTINWKAHADACVALCPRKARGRGQGTLEGANWVRLSWHLVHTVSR